MTRKRSRDTNEAREQSRASVVYVDEAIFEWRGKVWCHMFSHDLDALHSFARKLGLKRSWFQQPPKASWCHYDITTGKRHLAVALGAVEVDRFYALSFARPGRPVQRRTSSGKHAQHAPSKRLAGGKSHGDEA